MIYYFLRLTLVNYLRVINVIDYKVIGSRIKEQRTKCRMTQERLSELADITTVYLSKIENGRVHPTLDLIDSICSILGCDLGYVIANSSPTSNNYQTEHIVQLFNSCSPEVKPIAIELLEKLSKL